MDKSPKDFADAVSNIGKDYETHKKFVDTEQHTKTAFVNRLITALGYDFNDPLEVVPEHIADLKAKKGEKVDYVIKLGGQPILTIECKHWKQNLDGHKAQLRRYYQQVPAKFGVLTNGKDYEFYADLVKPNVMDDEPFFKFDITSIKKFQIDFLWTFSKSQFNLEKNIQGAVEMRQLTQIRENIGREFLKPSDELVKSLTQNVYKQQIKTTATILSQFRELVKRSIDDHITEEVEKRVSVRIEEERPKIEAEIKAQYPQLESSDQNSDAGGKIVTTQEELDGFYIVKGIVRKVVDAKRITYKDSQKYFSIILDDSSHKTICRLYMNGKKKSLGTFDAGKNETKNEIATIDDIFKFADTLIETAQRLGQNTK